MTALPIAIATLRKNWSFPPMNSSTSPSSALSRVMRASAGASARSSRLVHATLRWCISSPMERPRATSALSGTSEPARRVSPSSGPSVEASHRSRSSTESSLPPKRMTLPSPSFTVQQARLPNARFSTTITGIVRVVSPVIGPTAPWWWFGANRISPDAARALAASSVGAQPSSTIAPATAPRIGPHIRSHSMGGPACRIIRSSSPAIASPAGTTSTSTGSAASIRSTATALAASTRSVSRASDPVIRSSASSTRASALAGGVHATSTTGTPAARRSSANPDRPTFTTRGPFERRSAAVKLESPVRRATAGEDIRPTRAGDRASSCAGMGRQAGVARDTPPGGPGRPAAECYSRIRVFYCVEILHNDRQSLDRPRPAGEGARPRWGEDQEGGPSTKRFRNSSRARSR